MFIMDDDLVLVYRGSEVSRLISFFVVLLIMVSSPAARGALLLLRSGVPQGRAYVAQVACFSLVFREVES